MAYFSILALVWVIHTSYVNASVGSSCSSYTHCKHPEETCSSSLCDCASGYYRDESDATNIVCRAYRHAEICDHAKYIVCETASASCSLAEDSSYRCICSSSGYYQPATGKCSSVSDLAVTVTSTNITAKTITITWNADNKGIPVNYTITWNSGPGIIDYVNKTGGRLYNLEPYSSYSLKLITIVPGNSFYSEKTASISSDIRTKKIPYGDTCSKPGDTYFCNDQNTKCIQTPSSNGLRCLCDDGSYLTPSNVCESLSRLAVTLTSTQVTSETATLTWSAENRGIHVNYTITWSSGTGTIDYVNSTGARLYNLQPYTGYTFYLQTIVPGISYYSEKTASTAVSIQTKKIPYSEPCTTLGSSSSCDESNTICIQTQSSSNFRCLCNDAYFWSPSNHCESLSTLAVTVTSVESTSRTATLTWNADNKGIAVTYTITWSSGVGSVDYVNGTGARLYNLEPGRAYNLKLITVVPRDSYYSEKTASTFVTVGTEKIPYGDTCTTLGSSSLCNEDNTKCIQTPSSGSIRCLCDDAYFRSASNLCESLSILAVTVTSVESTSQSVTFMWNTDNKGIDVTYTITWSSGVGSVDYVNGTGARLYNLEPGKSYYLKLITVVPGDSYYSEKTASTSVTVGTEKIGHAETCSLPGSSYICKDVYTKCLQTESSGGYRCLCDDNYFRNPSNVCELLSNLKVSVYSTSSTSTTVSFLWNTNKKELPVTYTLEWNSPEGRVDYINETGGTVSGLTPGYSYTFTVGSVLPASEYYPEKKVTLTLPSLKTGQASHGEQCDSSSTTNLCIGDHTACIQTSLSVVSRCLCQDGYYRSSDNSCRDLNELKVSNLKVTRLNSSEAYLTWTANKHGTSVSYIIQSSPGGVKVMEPVNDNGGQVIGLEDRTNYIFTVVSLLPASGYYTQKTVSVSVSSSSSFSENENGSSEGENIGMIVGIVVAVIAVAVLAVVLGIVYWKRRQSRKTRKGDYDQPNNSGVTGRDNYAHCDITGQETNTSTSVCAESGNIPLRPMLPAPNNHSSHVYDTVINGNADGDYEPPLEQQDGEHKDHVYMNI